MSKWFSLQKILSYNSIFNIVMSSRGGGKTYESLRFMIDLYKKKKKQSIYIRRNKVELDEIKPTFFHAIQERYPDDVFHVRGSIGYINNEPMVHFVALTNSGNLKSKAFPNVEFALFDEYIITDNGYKKYVKNEMTHVLDILETVFRAREGWRIVFLSNSVSYVCPLFSFFNIEPDPTKEIQRFCNNRVTLQLYESEEFLNDKKETEFAKLLEGTSYYSYAVENNVLEDTSDFIVKESIPDGRLMMSFYSNNMEVGVWTNGLQYHINDSIDKQSKRRYAILNEDMREGLNHIKDTRNTMSVRRLKQAYFNGDVYYKSQEIKKFFERNVARYL